MNSNYPYDPYGGNYQNDGNYQNGSNYQMSPAGPQKKTPKAGRFFSKFVSLLLAAVIFGSVSAFSFNAVYNQIRTDASDTATSKQGELISAGSDEDAKDKTINTISKSSSISGYSVSDIAKLGLPSTVAITNKSVQEVRQYFGIFGFQLMPQMLEKTSFGSGIIVRKTDEKLFIVTNYHVIEDSQELSVSLSDDTTIAAELEVTSESDDLAIVSVSLKDIPEETLKEISVAKLGDSEDVIVGEGVVAIGNALGYGMSVSSGVVSAVDRQISTGNSDSYQNTADESVETYIQTDAAINPGNSGGALFNMDGEVIGINTVKVASTEVEGMGYAIPIDKIQALLETCLK